MAKATPHPKTTQNFNVVLYLVIALLIGLNYACFVIYRDSHITETFPTQLWNYLSSDLCKLITISLFIPIITLILESNFKFIQSIMENRIERENAIRAERTQKRREVILSTQTMLNRVFDLTLQVQHYQAGGPKRPSPRKVRGAADRPLTKIDEIIMEMDQFTVTAEDIVNEWDTFKIPTADSDMFLYFINLVLNCAADVARSIAKPLSPQELRKLQLALGVIWGGVKDAAHQNIISMLKLQMELLELEEDEAPEEQIKKVKADIVTYRKALASWLEFIKSIEQPHRGGLPGIRSKPGAAFNEAYEKAREFMEQNPKKKWYEYEEEQTVKDLYDKIPRQDRFEALAWTYPTEFILHLADELGYDNFRTKPL